MKYRDLIELYPDAKNILLDSAINYHTKPISDYSLVTLTDMGNILEVQYLKHRNDNIKIRKINASEYVDLETGEIKTFKKNTKRIDDLNQLRQTFKNARYLINNNFYGNENELFLTLTYKDNMNSNVQLYDDFKKFIKRLKYKYGKLEYINFVEPQGRGAWHCHVLVKFLSFESIYIPNKFDKKTNKPIDAPLYDLWERKGWVTVQTLKGIDNIGAYITAYLTDIPVDDSFKGTDVVVKDVNGIKKKFKKGGRLHLYPKGMRFYRKSRGIKYPERVQMYYDDVKKITGSHKPVFEYRTKIERDNFETEMKIEQYNFSREL